MLIGILQCDEVRESMRDQFVDYPDMFRELLSEQDEQLQFRVYRAIDSEFPASPGDCDAYIITGSRSGVYEAHDWIPLAEKFVRDVIAANKPLIGVCFGHQLIAQAMGGRVEKSEKGWGQGLHTWEVNHRPAWMDEDVSSFSMLVSHQDQVLELPPGAKCLASSDFCSVAAFQLGENALGFQGHPEFSKAYSQAIMDVRRDMLGESIYTKGVESLTNDPDRTQIAGWMLDFMRQGSQIN